MKVIFTQDIPGGPKKYETKEVSGGWARNYLLPRGFAVLDTKENRARIENARKRHEREVARSREALRELMALVSGKTVSMKAKANKEGGLFAKIHPKDIAQSLADEFGYSVDEKFILLENDIERIGTYTVELGEGKGSKVSFTVVVEDKAEVVNKNQQDS